MKISLSRRFALSVVLICLAGCVGKETEGAQIPSKPPHLIRAEIAGARDIRLIFDGPLADLPEIDQIVLKTAVGTRVPIDDVVRQGERGLEVVPAHPLDVARVHHVAVNGHGGPARRVRFDGWFRTLYSDRPLGATIMGEGAGVSTMFAIFAPRARGMVVRIFTGRWDSDPAESLPLQRDENGVWSAQAPGDLTGAYYDVLVDPPMDNGGAGAHRSGFIRISDPYARIYDEVTGRGRIARPVAPPRPLPGSRPAMVDVIAYEVHVQDFTDLLPVSAAEAGAFDAMVREGLTNAAGVAIGFDHLVDLGVNVVHLMPVQEYLHHSDVEWRAAFAQDERMRQLAIADENYQWGYRTTHAFAIEGRYGPRAHAPGGERTAFRDLVDAFHAKGIAVIVDIVPNHTGENMDGHERLIHFNALDRAYYYRTDDDLAHIGPFGNEVKTEERPMVRRWLIEQCRRLVEEYGIDGFRIDLAGQIDEQSLVALRAALGPDILIYGEPWIAVTDPYVRANPDWQWYKSDSPITFFQDEARDAFKGSPFMLEDKKRDRGFAGGNGALRTAVMQALGNTYSEEARGPDRGINYLDIHDNWALADRFATFDWNGLMGVDVAHYRVAAGLLMTSMGPVVLHGGVEIMRSKGMAPRDEWAVDLPSATLHFKGRDDTYNLRAPNRFRWETVGAPGFAEMYRWWRGLIQFRHSEAGAAFRRTGPLPADYYQWILPDDDRLLGYIVDGRILVLVNVSAGEGTFEGLSLPPGQWRQIADGERIDPENGVALPVAGGALNQVIVPPESLSIWVRD